MQLQEYFDSTILNGFKAEDYLPYQIGSSIDRVFSDPSKIQIAIFSVAEERGSRGNEGCSKNLKHIRRYFYQLSKSTFKTNLADLGEIKAGDSITDTYFAVKEVVSFLIKQNIIPVIIGGSADLVYGNYLAYTVLEQTTNLVSISSRFALGETDDSINSSNFFSKILLHQPNALFNYSQLAFQSYFVDHKELKLFEELYFDVHRLGLLKEDIRNAEPVIRNADFVAFDVSAIENNYAPANKLSSPNGLNAEQACQLARYAGISDKLSSFGIYEYNQSLDGNGQTAHLIAQMIWYFIEGVNHRKEDFPVGNKKDYTKYTVSMEEGSQELVFYKSPKSDRWWMEVPYPKNVLRRHDRHVMVPCKYEDYKEALKNELPEKWMQTFQKLR